MAGAAWFGECNNAQGVWLGVCGDARGVGPNCCWSTSVPGNCTNQHFTLNASDGTITTPYWPNNNNAPGPYLTLDGPTPNSLFFEERFTGDAAATQQWTWDASTGTLTDAFGTCLGAAPRDTTNVWARRLSKSGEVALLFINNGAVGGPVSCDAVCCKSAGLDLNATYRVRDIFAHTDNGTVSCSDNGGVVYHVPAGGASVFVRLHSGV